MSMEKRAFTAVELMVALILMVLILTALWRVFSTSQRNAKEIIENHTINEELDKTLIKMTDDIREANGVASYPILYEESQIAGLETKESSPSDESENKLTFYKVNYDFSKKPSEMAEGEVNYTTNLITYYVVPNDNSEGKWTLFREMTPLNENKEPMTDKKTLFEILPSVDECVFYRIKDPDAVRTGNIYIKIKIGRKEKDKYSNETVISVKERGAMPES